MKAMFRGDTEKMTERELSIIRALGEEFSTVLADLQRTFEGKWPRRHKRLKKNWLPVGGITEVVTGG
ncbi:Putative phage portal protein [Escherichia coli]|nr:Putative phage portal protein [Escherichia coli]